MNKWTRRAFITAGVLAGGTVIFGIAIRPGNRASKVAKLIGKQGDTVLNIWLKIAADNTVTVIIPHAEMGQGVHTTLAMMLAEELDADWSLVRFEEAPAHKEYANPAIIKGFVAGEADFPPFLIDTVDGVLFTAVKKLHLQLTVGSASVRFTGMHAMRVAGASARSMLLQAAASLWNVPESELSVKKSLVSHAGSNRSASFAELAPLAVKYSGPAKPTLKKESEFSIMGTSPLRFDIPAKVNGSAQYGIDMTLPGMKFAAVKNAPVFGSTVKSFDESAIKDMTGVIKVVNLGSAVAVIAENFWTARTAVEKLPVTYTDSGNEKVDSGTIYDQYLRDMDHAMVNGDNKTHYKSGDAGKAISETGTPFEQEYRIPYLAHATMEPMNCTAWIHDGICELWAGSQNPLGFAGDVAETLGMDDENVHMHNMLLGGAFGRRAETDVAKQAARIAKEVAFPVKLVWTREEDMRHDMYREANISRLKAVLDKNGMPVAITHQFLFKHHPPEAPDIPYRIPNQLVHFTTSQTHVPWGSWRSVDHSMHGFFIESFIDELAHTTHKDPYQYRRELLSHEPRFLKVLDLAFEKSDWQAPLPPGWGRGIAIVKSFGTIAAEVIEAEVTQEGEVRVHRVVCAVDPGFAVHPNGFTAQMESGIIYGLSAALMGEITIEAGAVKQSNFHDYPVLRMNRVPVIETHIINSNQWPGGAGEPSTPLVAPALANAIFDATGIRIRQLPIRNHDLSHEHWTKLSEEVVS